MKQDLIEEISVFLLREGYTLKSLRQACFDIVARKDERVLLVKILEDANSLTGDSCNEMKKVCGYLGATPVIVSGKAGEDLLDNVVYSRFGTYCVNFSTFKSCVQNNFPFVYSDHSGLSAALKGSKLKEIREREGFSISSLARRIGVSNRMILKYENEKANVGIGRALKMHRIFGDQIFDKINLFREQNEDLKELKTDIGRKFENLGFNTTETRKVPFDLIAKKDSEIVLTEVGDRTDPNLRPLSMLIGAENLVIYNKKKPKNIPGLTKKEFLEFEKSFELLRFIKEY